MSQNSQIEERALQMLGSGAPAHIVASALGVTESRISQMLAEETFAQQVQDLRFYNLQKHTKIDEKYLDLEDKLLEKLEKVMPLMSKPRDVLAAVQVINNAKRRGAQVSQESRVASQVVNLTVPVQIVHKYISNINNQVVEVQDDTGGASSLVTATSGSLDRLAAEHLDQIEGGQNESAAIAPQELRRLESTVPARERLGTGSQSKGVSSGPISVEDLL